MKRNHGIDFLRILSMFMVVILHVCGRGGILAAAEPNSLKYWVAWLLEISCLCAVNSFALISGYVMYHSKPRASKALSLWLQTLFYTVLALLLFLIFKPEAIDMRSIVSAVFPVTRNHYWYITAYFGVLVLSPLLNVIIIHTEKRVFGAVLLVGFFVFSILPHFLLADPYILSGGFSMVWLALLYLVGGYISKHNISDKVKTNHAWLVVGLMILLTLLSKFVLESIPKHILPTKDLGNTFIDYTSPTIILIAAGLLIIYSKQNFSNRITKLIGILAPASLGVYLIHVNRLVFDHLFTDAFAHFVNYNLIVMVLLILVSAVVIYAICTAIELIRIRLFKAIRIDKLCTAAETRLENLFQKYSKV